MKQSGVDAGDVVGIGVDFTSCTMLPCSADGTPLCLLDEFKHVAARVAEALEAPRRQGRDATGSTTSRASATSRGSRATAARSGSSGSFPRCSRRSTTRPQVYDAADVWLEAGDWLVWQLTSGPFPRCDAGELVRSTCQAGYKAMWNAQTRLPVARVLRRGPSEARRRRRRKDAAATLRSPGRKAGGLTDARGEAARAARRHPRLRRDHRRARGRPRRGRRVAVDDGDGPGHQLVPHAEQPHRAARARHRGRRRGRHPARATSATRPARRASATRSRGSSRRSSCRTTS